MAGLLKHVAQVESGRLGSMRGEQRKFDAAGIKQWEAGFVPGDDEKVDGLIAFYGRVARATGDAVRQLGSLDTTFDVPKAPWDEGGPRSWRWGLLHLIEESARHADVIRESVDGKFALVCETGAMPEPDWPALNG